MKITVTQQHIARGLKGKPRDCPLAIAINEQCPAYEAAVYGKINGVQLCPLLGGDRITVPMPHMATLFTVNFDAGRLAKPRWWQPPDKRYVFDFEIPESCVTGRVERTSVPNASESVTASFSPKS